MVVYSVLLLLVLTQPGLTAARYHHRRGKRPEVLSSATMAELPGKVALL